MKTVWGGVTYIKRWMDLSGVHTHGPSPPSLLYNDYIII